LGIQVSLQQCDLAGDGGLSAGLVVDHVDYWMQK
jgi:hypothetical protein